MQYGHLMSTTTVKILLDAGANVQVDNNVILRNIVQRGYIYGYTKLAKLLLEYGADVHAINEEALLASINSGCESMVKILLDAGANYDAIKHNKMNRTMRTYIESYIEQFL